MEQCFSSSCSVVECPRDGSSIRFSTHTHTHTNISSDEGTAIVRIGSADIQYAVAGLDWSRGKLWWCRCVRGMNLLNGSLCPTHGSHASDQVMGAGQVMRPGPGWDPR